MSQVSCEAVQTVLRKQFSSVRICLVNNLSDLEALLKRKPGLIFLGMEFIPFNSLLGREDPNRIWLSELLERQGIPCTGSSQAAHFLQRDKPLAKQRVLDSGLKTAPFFTVRSNQMDDLHGCETNFPMFVKPTNRGGGSGVDSNSVVLNKEQLRAKVHSISSNLQANCLVEEYLSGREFSVAILKQEKGDNYQMMPIELIAPPDVNGSRLLSKKVKSDNSEKVLAVSDPAIHDSVCDLALKVFDALGARDYGRIDIRLDASGCPCFLEANLIPSLISGYGSFPKACLLNFNLELEQVIMRIVHLGLAHKVKSALVEREDEDNPPLVPQTVLSYS